MRFLPSLLLGYSLRGKKTIAYSYSNCDYLCCPCLFHSAASNRPYTTRDIS